MHILDNVIQLSIERNEENYHRNNKESMNRTKKDTKSMKKDYFSKSEHSSLQSTDQNNSYDNEDIYINEDNMSSLEKYPSIFEEQLKRVEKVEIQRKTQVVF